MVWPLGRDLAIFYRPREPVFLSKKHSVAKNRARRRFRQCSKRLQAGEGFGARWRFGEWLGPESNRRHEDFQSSALPTELPSHGPQVGTLVCSELPRQAAIRKICGFEEFLRFATPRCVQ